MKIMYLTDVGFDTPNSNNNIVLSMLKEFLTAGEYVYLIQSHSTGTYPDIPDELINHSKFEYDIVFKPIIDKKNFIKRYLFGIKYAFDARKKWSKKVKEMDVILVQSHFTAVFSIFLLRKYHKKLIFSIYDIFPGDAYTNGSMNRAIYVGLSILQKYIYITCSRFFVLAEDNKKTLVNLGVKEKQIDIIPIWVDDRVMKPIELNDNKFIAQYNLDKRKQYVQYAGSIGVSYQYQMFAEVAEHLQNRKDVIIQIVGDGIYLDNLKALIRKKGLTNVQFIPWQPMELLSDVYSACTIQLIPLRKEVICNSFPSKIMPLMACKKTAVIAVEQDSAFYRLVNQEGIGIATPLNDSRALANAIIYLLDNKTQRFAMEQNAKTYVEKKHNANENTRKMLDIFTDLIKGE